MPDSFLSGGVYMSGCSDVEFDKFTQGIGSLSFKEIDFPIHSSFKVSNVQLLIQGGIGQPKELTFHFMHDKDQKTVKRVEFDKLKRGLAEWYRIDVPSSIKPSLLGIIHHSLWEGSNKCTIYGIAFGFANPSTVLPSLARDSDVEYNASSSGDSYKVPRTILTISAKINPDLAFPSSISQNQGKKLLSDGKPEPPVETASLEFHTMTIPFVETCSIECIQICIFGDDRQPKYLDAALHKDCGEVVDIKYSLPRVAKKGENEWHSLPVGVDDVLKCRLECVEAWDGTNRCELDGLKFLLEDRCKPLTSASGVPRTILTISAKINPDLAFPSSISQNQGKKLLSDGKPEPPVETASLEFHTMTIPFVETCSIECIQICIFGDDRQPKYLDAALHKDCGEVVDIKYSLPRVAKKGENEWHSLPVGVDDVLKCRLECVEAWDGTNRCELDGLKFLLEDRCKPLTSASGVELPKQEDKSSRRVRDLLDGRRPLTFAKLNIPFFTIAPIQSVYIEVYGCKEQAKELEFVFHTKAGGHVRKEFTVDKVKKKGDLEWHYLPIGHVEAVISCDVKCLSCWNGDNYGRLDGIRFLSTPSEIERIGGRLRVSYSDK
ncbi:hypothetical protein ADUPG1_011216 [Aduncisulcus paluster]|uniref:Uncharacterized protein n=1 Tax=Aduncisulcus paluster TaxID=2918883 RepID=A0ABQ5JV56_9EUKA|nr:hypothetical protein ADUPG1_011216 [Aduncisulcus paluster]